MAEVDGAGLHWIAADWPAPSGIRVVSSTRGGGVSAYPYASLNLGLHVGDARDDVAKNRLRLRAAARLPAEPRWLTQVHGTAVANLDCLDAYSLPTAAAAITHAPATVCAILTADCLPLVFASATGSVIGAAHAGWRGLAAGVIEALAAALGTPASEILVWLGPAIGVAHFEVGSEVRDALLEQDADATGAFIRNAAGRYQADLEALARRRLKKLGISQIYGGGHCTYAERDRYFSHRRDGQTGRQATLIWREEG